MEPGLVSTMSMGTLGCSSQDAYSILLSMWVLRTLHMMIHYGTLQHLSGTHSQPWSDRGGKLIMNSHCQTLILSPVLSREEKYHYKLTRFLTEMVKYSFSVLFSVGRRNNHHELTRFLTEMVKYSFSVLFSVGRRNITNSFTTWPRWSSNTRSQPWLDRGRNNHHEL